MARTLKAPAFRPKGRDPKPSTPPAPRADRPAPAAPPPPSVPGRTAGVPTPPKKARNTGWMIVGAALIVLSGLTAASVVNSLSQSVDVLVAARPIAEGAVVSEKDVRSVAIAADTGDIQAIAPNRLDELIGRVASGPIGEGSILHPDQFTSDATEAEDPTLVIGAALGPNDLPFLRLLPGDQVRLFETSPTGGSDRSSSAVAREITDAEVVEVTELGAGGAVHLALRLNESSANIVADRIEQGRLAVALMDSLPSVDDVVPLTPVEPLAPGDSGIDQ